MQTWRLRCSSTPKLKSYERVRPIEIYISTIILIYLLLSVIQVRHRITHDRHRTSSIIIYLLRNDGIILCCYYNIIVITLFQSHPHRRLEITRCNNIINIPITFLCIYVTCIVSDSSPYAATARRYSDTIKKKNV